MLSSFFKNFILFLLIVVSVENLYASDMLINNEIKSSIIKHFKNKKITFLYIKKMQDNNYLAIIKYNHTQDRITIDKSGKILSIVDDLSVMDEAEEGC